MSELVSKHLFRHAEFIVYLPLSVFCRYWSQSHACNKTANVRNQLEKEICRQCTGSLRVCELYNMIRKYYLFYMDNHRSLFMNRMNSDEGNTQGFIGG